MMSADTPSLVGSAVPVIVVADKRESEQVDEGLDSSPFFEYLDTERGHEIATSVIEIVQDLKKAAVSQATGQARLEKILQIGIVLAVIVAASTLAALGKLDSPISILFGTLVGYVFGRKSN